MIRPATKDDYKAVCGLLETEKLPTSDIRNELPDFFVEEENNRVIGSIGLDSYGDAGLLRSMIVINEYRNRGIASALIEQLITHARKKGLNKLYLVTNKAEKYFSAKGFERVERSQVDKELLVSGEFNGLCPASSVIMLRQI